MPPLREALQGPYLPAKRKEESNARQSNHSGESVTVLVELLSETVVYQQNAKIYPHIYPQWDIAFARVFGYCMPVKDVFCFLHWHTSL